MRPPAHNARLPVVRLAALFVIFLAVLAVAWSGTNPAGAQDGHQPDPNVVDDVWEYAEETQHGADHVLRWMRVLHTFGVLAGMTAAEAQENADQYWAQRWDPVVTELTKLEAEDNYQPDQQVVDDVRGYAAETDNGFDHVLRWMRVLRTLGALDDMTATEAQGYADQYSAARWDPVVAELTALETAASEPEPTPEPEESAPGAPANFAVSATAGEMDLSANWDALAGADSYKLAWRQDGGEFEAANAATVTTNSATITVSGFGRWEVRLEGCNDAGCGAAVTAHADVVPAPETAPLQVAVAANPANPRVNEATELSAVISNAPKGETPSYNWEIEGGGEWQSYGSRATLRYLASQPESLSVRVTVSYESGKSATSDALTVTWTEGPPNRAPVVNTQAEWYHDFVGKRNAPRGVLVWKMFHGIFSDPDGDELTYAASVPADQSQLVDDLQIRLARTLSSGEKADILFFLAEAEANWKAITPPLPDRPVITVTLNATDPDGLSASVSGDFVIWWASYPEVVRARANGAGIELTFDWALEANPAPAPGQFAVNVVNGDGSSGTIGVNSVSVSGKVLTLGLASALDRSQIVTLDYAYDYLDDTALQRAGGGDPAPGFAGQAVEFLQPPGEPQNFAVSAEAGSLDVSATWDAVDGAASYRLRWRESGGEFEAENTATVTDASTTISVPDYGEWEFQLQACNDAGCGPPITQQAEVEPPPDSDELRVIVTAWPDNPVAPYTVILLPEISNAPSSARPSYQWEIAENSDDWRFYNSRFNSPGLAYLMETSGSRTFRITVSYGNGDSATSDPITVVWARRQPNRAPVVNDQAGHYSDFVERQNAPRGNPVNKLYEGIFSDPDGDELSYTVSVPHDRSGLVKTLGVYTATHRVGFEMDAHADWKAVSPALPDPLTTTVTLTATDTDGLSTSVSGDFVTDWESHPALVRATASKQAVALAFDLEVQANPAPGPGQFTVNVVDEEGSEGTIVVSSVSVNGAVVTLELASALVIGQRVTLDYAHHDNAPLQRASGGGDSTPSFTGQAVEFPLATSTSSSPVCDRTPQIRDAIVIMIPDASNCAEVTDEQLAAITGDLRLRDKGITTLRVGDFGGLINLNVLDLQHNLLKSLPQGVFDGLTRMNRLRLNNNQLTELSRIFSSV